MVDSACVGIIFMDSIIIMPQIIPIMVEFNGGPTPSLFVPNTVTTIFEDEGQAITKDARLSTCSQVPHKQDAAGTLTEVQSVPKVESV